MKTPTHWVITDEQSKSYLSNSMNNSFQSDVSNLRGFKEDYVKILIIMKPVLPHLISECLSNLNITNTTIWPSINEKYIEQKSVNIVIQIDGKKRGLVECKKDILEEDLIKIINEKKEINKYLNEKKIKKKIYVKNKIINFILK